MMPVKMMMATIARRRAPTETPWLKSSPETQYSITQVMNFIEIQLFRGLRSVFRMRVVKVVLQFDVI